MSAPLPTTFIDATFLVPESGIQLILATETFQNTGSFKFRAGYEVAKNTPHSHIIAASSGNFGQALACACKIFGKRCTIVMPKTSAQVKIDGVRSYGATVDLIDISKITREARVQQLIEDDEDVYVTSAFDDPFVIAGNASIGEEILKAYPATQAIIAPLGGGGLTAGLAVAVKGASHPVKVFGAEPLMANDGARSFRAGELLTNETEPQTIADGARTRSLGKLNWEVLHTQCGLYDVLEVPEEAILQTVRDLFLKVNLKCEPTGALAVAAFLQDFKRLSLEGIVCCIVSGGNVDPAVYARILNAG